MLPSEGHLVIHGGMERSGGNACLEMTGDVMCTISTNYRSTCKHFGFSER